MSRKTLLAYIFLFFFLSYLANAALVVCLDGGGTKTKVTALNDGEPCRLRVCTAPANSTAVSINLGPANTQSEARERALVDALFQLEFWSESCQGWVPLSSVVDELRIVAGLAGAGGQAKRTAWAKYFEDRGVCSGNVHVNSDVGMTLAALDGPAVVLIAGTGSVGFGKVGDETELIQEGGLGWFLGDEGSGFYVGRQAIRLAFTQGVNREDPFIAAILKQYETDFGERSIGVLHANILGGGFSPAQVAAFAPIVFEFANQGNELAASIVSDAANALAQLLAKVLGQMDVPNVTVYLVGGLFRDQGFLARVQTSDALSSSHPQLTWDTSYLAQDANPAEAWAVKYVAK